MEDLLAPARVTRRSTGVQVIQHNLSIHDIDQERDRIIQQFQASANKTNGSKVAKRRLFAGTPECNHQITPELLSFCGKTTKEDLKEQQ
ncbi:unnamed protein product [Angiostrongylus costaricensis]|uniref:Condensin complex subunit 2 n=1 Tax=Angiostrongylus costaricensis TaxID=334426 RepID=A0A0R3PZ78_ANGCS|nr:unnamed protein product [Angiostrongylus costaricensis]